MIRRLKRMFFKRKHYNKFPRRPSWQEFNELEDKYYKLSNKLNNLAASLDRQLINSTFVSGKDAKKYQKNSTCIY